MIHVKMDYMADIVRAFVIVVNQSSVTVLQDPVCITVLLVELERNVIKLVHGQNMGCIVNLTVNVVGVPVTQKQETVFVKQENVGNTVNINAILEVGVLIA